MSQTERHRSGEAYHTAWRLGLREGIGLGSLALIQYVPRMSEQVWADLA